MAKKKTMQESITTTILQVGRPMKKKTTVKAGKWAKSPCYFIAYTCPFCEAYDDKFIDNTDDQQAQCWSCNNNFIVTK